ncbi:MAG: Omp28-related outer membrane protein [Candidatus Kapabacteria bacterium]|nr:Omp28-related outer membrane protein [Candidatus Kapabacteria bacterium]
MKKIIQLFSLFFCSSLILISQTFTPTKKVVLEDHTQCSPSFGQWSPRGIVKLADFMSTSSRTNTEIISVHSTIGSGPIDPMTDSLYSYSSQNSTYLHMNGWPSISFDRKSNNESDSLPFYYQKYITDFGVADINVSLIYNQNSRALNVTANAHFGINSKNYKLALVLTEDSVHGTTIEYSQRNNYANGANGPMSGGGVDFAAQPDPVPASVMYYRNVVRAILPSYSGADNSLPANLTAGQTYNYNFPTYFVPSKFNYTKMRAIVLLINSANGQIVNANGTNLNDAVMNVEEFTYKSKCYVNASPNPFSEYTNFNFNLPIESTVSFEITNNLGQKVAFEDLGILAAGDHNYQFNAKNNKSLNTGVYYVTLKTNFETIRQSIILER